MNDPSKNKESHEQLIESFRAWLHTVITAEQFGLKRRLVATFEEPVKNIRGQYGFIDLFWPGVVLVEHKNNLSPRRRER